MRRRVRVSRRARADLDEIWEYVAEQEQSIPAATKLTDHITNTFPLLGTQPSIGRRREDFAPGTRTFPVGQYIIYYRKAAGEASSSPV